MIANCLYAVKHAHHTEIECLIKLPMQPCWSWAYFTVLVDSFTDPDDAQTSVNRHSASPIIEMVGPCLSVGLVLGTMLRRP